jgi:uncharacterized RDD family membrane protein YckC
MVATYCSQCGQPVRAGARFCGACGGALAGVLPWQTEATPRASEEGQYAGFWIRFVAWFIDGVVVSIVTQPITLALGSGFSFEVEENALGEPTSFNWDLDETRLIIGAIIGFAVPLVYWMVAFSKWGQTLGALAVSIKVQHPDGTLLSPALAAVRYFGSIVSGLIFGLGYFWMIWDGSKQTWHDKFANSVVVKVKRRGEL